MTAYAVAHLTDLQVGQDILRYLEKIDATLPPYAGRFLVHGSSVETLEGQWPGDLVVAEFPDRQHARDWYGSSAYQAIVGLRTDNSSGSVTLVDGVDDGHRATDIAGGLAATLNATGPPS